MPIPTELKICTNAINFTLSLNVDELKSRNQKGNKEIHIPRNFNEFKEYYT